MEINRETIFQFSLALLALSAKVPARTTARQLLAFVCCVRAELNESPMSVGELSDTLNRALAPDPLGHGGSSRILTAFMGASSRDPDAVHWVTLRSDKEDSRKRIIELTDEGAAGGR